MTYEDIEDSSGGNKCILLNLSIARYIVIWDPTQIIEESQVLELTNPRVLT